MKLIQSLSPSVIQSLEMSQVKPAQTGWITQHMEFNNPASSDSGIPNPTASLTCELRRGGAKAVEFRAIPRSWARKIFFVAGFGPIDREQARSS